MLNPCRRGAPWKKNFAAYLLHTKLKYSIRVFLVNNVLIMLKFVIWGFLVIEKVKITITGLKDFRCIIAAYKRELQHI